MASQEQNIIAGGAQVTRYSESFSSLGNLLYFKLNAKPDKIAFIDVATGEINTYEDLKKKSLIIAEFLRQNGVKVGDVVGICSENSSDFLSTVYGVLFIGATVAPINYSYKEDEINFAFNLSKPKVIFGTGSTFEKLLNAVKEFTFVEKLIQYGSKSSTADIILFDDIMKNEKYFKDHEEFIQPPKDLDRAAFIALSSGTTGLPKGVQITEKNIIGMCGQIKDEKLPMGTGISYLSCLPWFHIYGFMIMLGITPWEVVLLSLPRFEEQLFLASIEKYKVTHALLVPSLMVFLAKHPLVAKFDLSSLQGLLCGGAPFSRDVENDVMTRIPNLKAIHQLYGLTEATPILSTLAQSVHKTGSVGKVSIGTYCKVIDIQTGKTLGTNEAGELCVKGAQVMKGYFCNDAATNAILDKDGWLHTGDVCYYDEDEFFFIVDRLKELIKYKSFQVPPAEIEAHLIAHPAILEAAVIGLPDENAGELPLAFVVKHPNSDLDEKTIVDYIASKVSKHKQLSGGVRFIEQVPKNSSGKILRRELRKLIMNK